MQLEVQRLKDLLTMANLVEKVHAGHPQCPTGIYMSLSFFVYELKNQMKEGEEKKPSSVVEMNKLRIEHHLRRSQLNDFRIKTNGFIPPEDASPSWRSLYKGLENLERDLMEFAYRREIYA